MLVSIQWEWKTGLCLVFSGEVRPLVIGPLLPTGKGLWKLAVRVEVEPQYFCGVWLLQSGPQLVCDLAGLRLFRSFG